LEGIFGGKTDTRTMDTACEHLEYRKKSPDITTVENAVVLPRKITGNGAVPVWGTGGVLDENLDFVDASAYKGDFGEFGGKYRYDEKTMIHSDEEVIYFGVFLKHWGHFLVDLCSRMWILLKEEFQHMKIVYCAEQHVEMDGNYLEFMERLGVKKENLVHVLTPVTYSKVIIPEVSYFPNQWFTKEYMEIFEQVSKDICYEHNFYYDKVYFTRKNFISAQKKEFGEEGITEAFERNGFEILSPEQLTLSQQLVIWNTAREIVCMNGSIPLNILFSRNDGKVIVLNKTPKIHENLLSLQSMMKKNIFYIDVYLERFANKKVKLGEGPFLLTPAKNLKKYFDKHKYYMPNEPLFRQSINTLKYLRQYFTRRIKIFLKSVYFLVFDFKRHD